MMKIDKMIDEAITVLVAILIVSFYLFELMWWGRYVLFGISFFITILYIIKKRGKLVFKIERFHIQVAFFSAFCFLSSLWAWNPTLAISKGITIISILVCFFFLYEYYRDLGTIDSLLKSIMYAGYAISIYSLIFYGFSGIVSMMNNGDRLGNDFTNANSIGLIAAISLIIQFYYLIQRNYNFTLVLSISAFIMLIISQSRKATIMFIAGIVYLTMSNSKNKNTIHKIYKIIIGLGLLLFMLYALSKFKIFSGVFLRFQSYFQSLNGTREVNIRDIYRSIGIQQFKKTPFFGIGMGNSAELLVSLGQRRTYLHDNFAEILSSGGIIGFVIYYSMYLFPIMKLIKYKNVDSKTTNLCIVLLFLITVMDYGMVTYFDKQQYIYLMCFFLQSKFIQEKYYYKNRKKGG